LESGTLTVHAHFLKENQDRNHLLEEICSNSGGIPRHDNLISRKSFQDQNSDEKLSCSQKSSNLKIEEVPPIRPLNFCKDNNSIIVNAENVNLLTINKEEKTQIYQITHKHYRTGSLDQIIRSFSKKYLLTNTKPLDHFSGKKTLIQMKLRMIIMMNTMNPQMIPLIR
jgi:hypothetical protein